MEKTGEQNPRLSEVAEAFLSSLPAEERKKTQVEVSKFVRWLGLSRQVKAIRPVDVANYGEHITPSAIKPLRSFLTYIWKKGLSTTDLAPHLRVKRTSPRTAVVWQTKQTQTILTTQGYANLEEELANLRSERARVIREIREAAADKDFRENAPLAAARERKSYLDGRIKEIEALLSQARVVEEEQDRSKIKLGDTVLLRNLSSGEMFTYTLVDPREANPTQGKLSVVSPLGKALLNKQKGQIIEVTAPAGSFSCCIEDILLPSEEAR